MLLAYPAHAQTNTGGASAGSDKPEKQKDQAPEGAAQPGQPAPAGAPAPGAPGPTVPGLKAVLLPDGTAAAPELAPEPVKQAIWAVNAALLNKPYRYGGGHRSFVDSGYDCSGTVSFALNAVGAGLLKTPLDSSSFMSWGEAGKGEWITVRTNPGHAYVVIAGLRLDTSVAYSHRARTAAKRKRARVASKALERGPRWRPNLRPSRGFTARHPPGF